MGGIATAQAAANGAGAIISNGTVQLGVQPTGNLVVEGGSETDNPWTNTAVGLRHAGSNTESLSWGCWCEGWGVADATSGGTGFADGSWGIHNVDVDSFTVTSTQARSVTRVDSTFRVVHHFRPSDHTPNLYVIDVEIQNISNAIVDLRYRRLMDWDIPPDVYDEYVTIQGSASEPAILFRK